MNNAKTMENIRKHRDIKLVTIERRRNYLVSEQNIFTAKFISNWNKKTEVIMNKPVYLGLSTLELSKILLYEFWYDLCKPKIW